MRIRVYPYKQGSKSAKALAEGLGGRVLKLEGSKFIPRHGDKIINWGCSGPINLNGSQTVQLINHPNSIRDAANKLTAFQMMKEAGVSVPLFAARREDVSWPGITVVRHRLSGHSGEGIEIVDAGRDLPNAPLYVQYIPKKDEYRVHVVGTSIIAVQRKAKRNDADEVNWKVRNHSNGFVFVRNDVRAPDRVLDEARNAVRALGLDFGAADVIWNAKQQQAYVLEVNTAPGLEGQTVDDYVNGFREMLR